MFGSFLDLIFFKFQFLLKLNYTRSLKQAHITQIEFIFWARSTFSCFGLFTVFLFELHNVVGLHA